MAGGYSFSQVPVADIPRSAFNRSHGHKTTFDSGYLIPFYVDEALPGDTFKVKASIFARLATPIVPIMDNMHLDVFFFAVPNRLLWDKWQRFMGEQPNPGDSIDFQTPLINPGATGFATGSIFDYFGLPTSVPQLNVCNFWGRAYNLIFNEWFRDENLQTRAVQNVGDGPDFVADYPLRRRGKRHDYFTSCLPWPQKGPGVELPLGTTAPIIPDPSVSDLPEFYVDMGAGNKPQTFLHVTEDVSNYVQATGLAGSDSGYLRWTERTGLLADLSGATSATINSLRQAFQIQRLLERDARGGTRYTEILRAHFGVISPDARLQRPEYLGGGSIPVSINPVTQTSGTPATPSVPANTPQGNLAGYGVVGSNSMGFSKSFVEHSVIVGLCMVRADLSYQYGVPRMFSRRTRYDFYWPAFSHLGEQAVLNKEIYAQGTPTDDGVFGYQERWAEYRYFPSKITGKFRSSDAQTLDFWHLAEKFDSLPTLSASFIEAKPPVERVIAVPSEPQFIFDSHMSIQAVRPMPTYSVPGMIDHF
ncbi:MAG: major capsid protein [Arizlama microvirus]|nr:MAG: major capsid protein [Arizlama microvirus]